MSGSRVNVGSLITSVKVRKRGRMSRNVYVSLRMNEIIRSVTVHLYRYHTLISPFTIKGTPEEDAVLSKPLDSQLAEHVYVP